MTKGVIAGAVLTTLTAFTALLFPTIVGSIRAVNEPDPGSFPTKSVVSNLEWAGFDCQVTDVQYVNRDFNGYIFKGAIKKASRPEPESNPEVYQGFIRRRSLTNGEWLIGALMATTRSEFRQGAPIFEAKWKATVDLTAPLGHDEVVQVWGEGKAYSQSHP